MAANVVFEMLKKRNRKRSCWTKEWLKRRSSLGASSTLLREISIEDEGAYKNYLRLTTKQFQWLLQEVEPFIQRQSTPLRSSVPTETKLQVTLQSLATGDSYASLQYLYRVSKATISLFVPEVTDAIWEVLKKFGHVEWRQELCARKIKSIV